MMQSSSTPFSNQASIVATLTETEWALEALSTARRWQGWIQDFLKGGSESGVGLEGRS